MNATLVLHKNYWLTVYFNCTVQLVGLLTLRSQIGYMKHNSWIRFLNQNILIKEKDRVYLYWRGDSSILGYCSFGISLSRHTVVCLNICTYVVCHKLIYRRQQWKCICLSMCDWVYICTAVFSYECDKWPTNVPINSINFPTTQYKSTFVYRFVFLFLARGKMPEMK